MIDIYLTMLLYLIVKLLSIGLMTKHFAGFLFILSRLLIFIDALSDYCQLTGAKKKRMADAILFFFNRFHYS